MRKKDYIEKAKTLILNRVRFHAPILFDDDLDINALKEFGIDENLPIFKFEKTLNKRLLKAFELALKEEKFNFVVVQSAVRDINMWGIRQLNNMHNTTILGEDCPKKILEMINKLNINYASSSNFNLAYKDKFFSVNGTRMNPSFQDFALCQCAVFDEVFVDYSEFVLNGKNIYARFLNKSEKEKKVTIELNIPLEKGYYYFRKVEKSFLIENLISKEKLFLNFLCPLAKFSFSNVDGLENSVFCCINVKVSLSLKPKQRRVLFFNFGAGKFIIKNLTEIEKLKEVSLNEAKKVFDVKVKTKNPQFDFFFNRSLPQKIWINWLNGKSDEALEQKYIAYRRLFVKGREKLSFVKFDEIGVREIGIFNGQYYKKILFVKSDEKFLKVGKTYFYQIGEISQKTLQSNEPVCLSFGA